MRRVQILRGTGGMRMPQKGGVSRRVNGTFLSALLMLTAMAASFAVPTPAQVERPHIDIDFYDIEADIDVATKTLEARVDVRFTPREATETVVFELHNALNVSRVEGEDGSEISAVRYGQDFTVRLSFLEVLPPEQAVTVTFFYDGQLEGTRDSPVEGYDLAAIEADRAYLLYPARWFPVNAYGADRFAANIQVTVDRGLQVIGSGLSTREENEDKVTHSFEFSQASFPGSIAVVPGEVVSVESDGVTTECLLLLRGPGNGRGLRRSRRSDGAIFHRSFFAAVFDLADTRRSRRPRSGRIRGAGHHFPEFLRSHAGSQPAVAGRAGRPAMVGRGDVAGQPESQLAQRRHGALFGHAVCRGGGRGNGLRPAGRDGSHQRTDL